MKKPKHYHCRTFRSDYVYFLGWSAKQFEKYCKDNFNLKIKADGNAGLTYEIVFEGEVYILIWVLDTEDYPVLSHECGHAAGYTLKRIGVKASFNNDECFAYLQQDIMEFAMD